jgi:hypothetical protein
MAALNSPAASFMRPCLRRWPIQVIPVYDECVRERRPVFLENTFLAPDEERVARHSRVLFLPLSEDDETVSMVLVIQHLISDETHTTAAFDPWATQYLEIQRRVL